MKQRIAFAGTRDVENLDLPDIRRQLGEAVKSVLAANGTTANVVMGVFWKSAHRTYAYRVISRLLASRTILEPGYTNAAFRDDPAVRTEIALLRKKAVEELKQLHRTCDSILAIERRELFRDKKARKTAPAIDGDGTGKATA